MSYVGDDDGVPRSGESGDRALWESSGDHDAAERQVILITGPIGAGKSTVADLLAKRFDSLSMPAAAVDLDDVVFMQRSRHDEREWQRGRAVHSVLTAAWLSAGVQVVVAHGPICTAQERADFLAEIPSGVDCRLALLRVPLDVSIARVLADDSRRPEAGSRVTSFLREAHARFEAVMEEVTRVATWDFDTTAMSPAAIAEAICSSAIAGSLARDPSR